MSVLAQPPAVSHLTRRTPASSAPDGSRSSPKSRAADCPGQHCSLEPEERHRRVLRRGAGAPPVLARDPLPLLQGSHRNRELPNPKQVIVHDNREIKKAEELFGKEFVFYSTDYREIFKKYSAAKIYVGSRIHGAIPSFIHGACINVLYFSDKAHVIETSAKILSKHINGINKSMKVGYIKDRKVTFTADFVFEAPDRKAIHLAIEKEKMNIQKELKQTAVLSGYLQ